MRQRYLIAIIAGIAALPLAALAQQAVPSIAPQADFPPGRLDFSD
jgi:hypothetical protein